MTGAFTTLKRANVMQEAEQIQTTTLVGMFPFIQDGAQPPKRVDTFGHHALRAPPGAAQQLAQFIPSRPQLFSQPGPDFIQAGCPKRLVLLLFLLRQRSPFLFHFNLPHSTQGGDGLGSIAALQRLQSRAQKRLITIPKLYSLRGKTFTFP